MELAIATIYCVTILLGLFIAFLIGRMSVLAIDTKTKQEVLAFRLMAIGVKGGSDMKPSDLAGEVLHRLVTMAEVKASAEAVLEGRAKSAEMFGCTWQRLYRKRDKNGKFAKA